MADAVEGGRCYEGKHRSTTGEVQGVIFTLTDPKVPAMEVWQQLGVKHGNSCISVYICDDCGCLFSRGLE